MGTFTNAWHYVATASLLSGAGPGLGRGTRLNLTRIRAEPKIEPAVQLLERSPSKSCPTPPKGAPVIAAMCGYALAHPTTVEVAYPLWVERREGREG
jgi:hypothetical protein